ncbi:hypothetical protein Q7C36_020367 [Tachysurus vachellii]|uniref:Uncharacterized protein n=1 Tax=Tachysurus vachellii TaxID=175792 RepID=A0AA88LTH3_TACVA|nr:hypothetical protein Q7C36_020367 [Tachysurus vachellii]
MSVKRYRPEEDGGRRMALFIAELLIQCEYQDTEKAKMADNDVTGVDRNQSCQCLGRELFTEAHGEPATAAVTSGFHYGPAMPLGWIA